MNNQNNRNNRDNNYRQTNSGRTNPRQRQNTQQNSKRPVPPERRTSPYSNAPTRPARHMPTQREIALAAERRRIEKINRRRRFQIAFRRAVGVLIFSVIGLVISLSALFIYIYHDFGSTSVEKGYPVALKFNDAETAIDSSKYAYKGGVYYVSLTPMSETLGFSILGDVKSMTMSVSETQYATFNVGSTAVCINGTTVTLDDPTYFASGQLYVPISFFTGYCTGVTAEVEKGSDGKVMLLTFGSSPEFICYATIPTKTPSAAAKALASQSQNPDGSGGEDGEGDTKPTSMFTQDLSAYEEYMNPSDRDEYLTLINTTHPLDSNYIPEDLTDFSGTRSDRAKQKLRKSAAMALEAMFKELYAAGYSDVTVTSGYRSYDYQTQLFNNEVSSLKSQYGDGAEAKAAEAVAIPGSSEHQSGLCADLHNLSSASLAFANEDAYKWLYAHCADFGFILRFPKDKTDITGIMFEPWHYRFVGRYHAQKIMSSGLCLEEYVAQNSGKTTE